MSKKPNILIVDDIDANLVALKRILPTDRANILQASSGMDALKIATEEPLALALLDVMMPHMNGYELAELLQGSPQNDHVPIIFVTANAGEDRDMAKGYDCGAVDYITKPINTHILRSKVNIFLDLYDFQRQQTDLNQELNMANRAKTNFIEAVNHELRTPMDGTLGMLELLMTTDLTNKQRNYTENALSSGHNLLDIIDNIYEFNMAENGEVRLNERLFNAHSLLQYSTDISNERIKCNDQDGTILSENNLDDISNFYGDTSITMDIILNLVDAALESSNDRNLTLRGSLKKQDVDSAELLFEIHDPSIFLSKNEVKNLFSAFTNSTNKSTTSNLGLRLAISDALLRHLGGAIGVTSTEALGTTYWLTMPVAKYIGKQPRTEVHEQENAFN
jgi:signal transduction histidine kinase